MPGQRGMEALALLCAGAAALRPEHGLLDSTIMALEEAEMGAGCWSESAPKLICKDTNNCGPGDSPGFCRHYNCTDCGTGCSNLEEAKHCCTEDLACTAVYGDGGHWWTFHDHDCEEVPHTNSYRVYKQVPCQVEEALASEPMAAQPHDDEQQREQEERAAFFEQCHCPHDISGEMCQVLCLHNLYRCIHNAPPMRWATDIAANAQNWADRGEYKHSSVQFRQQTGEPWGENLAWGTPTLSGATGVLVWYNEIDDTAGGLVNTTCMKDSNCFQKIGHYTQVVWTDSVKLGCGKGSARHNDDGDMGDFVVCQYGSSGNYRGQVGEKVSAPQFTEEHCKALWPATA